MRRAALALATLAAVAGATALVAPAAQAHPLGNFSVNHLTRVTVSADRIELRYILDQAEIPTFEERGVPTARVLAAKLAEVERHLSVTAGGRAIALRALPGATISHPRGQGGLPTTRVELSLRGPLRLPARVAVHDRTFAGRVGWRAVVASPGAGSAVRSTAPSGDPTDGLRHYPTSMLQSPVHVSSAVLSAKPGSGSLTAPRAPGGGETTTNRSGDGLTGLFEDAAAGRGVLLLLLLAAFGWGALHALSPGHGKTMVAAYLVGARGTPRHALALAATVTVTHTIGVFALGLVTLLLSAYVLPEDLYPWLNLASGLLVVGIGASLLRPRLRWMRARRAEARARAAGAVAAPAARDAHHHHHHEHPHGHAHEHTHSHGGRSHSHAPPDSITWRGLVAMGASAGLVPCPSALVVLLAAIAQHQVPLGLLMIVVFSTGLAMTLCAIGLVVVLTRRTTSRLSFSSRLGAAAPAISTVLIVGLGIVLTLRALPQLA